ncbi:hypothetical protein [Kitasatospora sp. NBC_01302]|uniref:hypothetical protein n=1 Tax=Kitasatospora sp. NBC_01302 TaxID=2903575 RepID=UPI002E15C439|nr:hypothetical protein OG294_27765 [Kitasatospora sp. NBC_01302]
MAERAMTISEFTAAIDRIKETAKAITEIQEVAPAAATAVAENTAGPGKPLHEMSWDDFHSEAAGYWARQGEGMRSPLWTDRQPLTLGEYLAQGRE